MGKVLPGVEQGEGTQSLAGKTVAFKTELLSPQSHATVEYIASVMPTVKPATPTGMQIPVFRAGETI